MPGPGFIPVANTVKVTYEGSFRGQQYIGDLWFNHIAGPPAAADVLNIVQQVGTVFVPALAAVQSEDLTYTFARGRDYTLLNGWTAEQGLSEVGGGGDAMPNNVCIAFSFRTGLAGRSYRGRNFVGAIPRTQIVENEVQSTFLSGGLSAFNLLIDPGFSPGWQWCVVSFRNAGAWRSAGVATPITNVVIVDNIVDDMDKRLPKRGS